MKAFALAAVTALGGAAMTLPWESIVSERTAGVVLIAIGAGIAIVKALYSPALPTKSE